MHSHEGSSRRRRGQIVQMTCNVQFHFFLPVFVDGKPNISQMAILSYGEHTHPPPPPHKIPQNVKTDLIRVIQAYGAPEATARRLIASPMLSIILNGKTTLNQ